MYCASVVTEDLKVNSLQTSTKHNKKSVADGVYQAAGFVANGLQKKVTFHWSNVEWFFQSFCSILVTEDQSLENKIQNPEGHEQ